MLGNVLAGLLLIGTLNVSLFSDINGDGRPDEPAGGFIPIQILQDGEVIVVGQTHDDLSSNHFFELPVGVYSIRAKYADNNHRYACAADDIVLKLGDFKTVMVTCRQLFDVQIPYLVK